MPTEYTHGLHFDVLHKEHPELVRINIRQFQQAMDDPQRVFINAEGFHEKVKKKMTHTDFDMFLKEYERVTGTSADDGAIYSLKYHWVKTIAKVLKYWPPQDKITLKFGTDYPLEITDTPFARFKYIIAPRIEND
jgi:hypothetical protein